MKIKKLILMLGISLFITSCGGDSDASSGGWPDSEKTNMLSECMASPESTKEMCDCAIDATVTSFTYEEYLSLQNSNETNVSEEMQERGLALMMAIMECAL